MILSTDNRDNRPDFPSCQAQGPVFSGASSAPYETGAGRRLIATRPSRALAQTPKRGGTLTIRAWDPPHFDASLVHAYKTHVAISFAHSRLLRHRAGEGVQPGSLMIEGDLAESWAQPSDTTYVFKLRRACASTPSRR
jgi:ABC-type transport system substrate-binding protein